MATNRSNIIGLLRPGVNSIIGDTKLYPEEWKDVFEFNKAKYAIEYDYEYRYPSVVQNKPEGDRVSIDSIGQRFTYTYEIKTFALSVVLTYEAMKDNLYEREFPDAMRNLKKSLVVGKETLGISIFNNAFNAGYARGDGQPLCSTAHPIDGGTYANTPVNNTDLSEAAVEQALIGIQTFPSQSGVLSRVMAQDLLVGPANQFKASRLTNSVYRTNTANNDINAVYHGDYLPKGYKVLHYMAPTNLNWFIRTDAERGLRYFEKDGVELATQVETGTFNIIYIVMARFCFGWTNPRSVWGAQSV
jgi:hypothetical protein